MASTVSDLEKAKKPKATAAAAESKSSSPPPPAEVSNESSLATAPKDATVLEGAKMPALPKESLPKYAAVPRAPLEPVVESSSKAEPLSSVPKDDNVELGEEDGIEDTDNIEDDADEDMDKVQDDVDDDNDKDSEYKPDGDGSDVTTTVDLADNDDHKDKDPETQPLVEKAVNPAKKQKSTVILPISPISKKALVNKVKKVHGGDIAFCCLV